MSYKINLKPPQVVAVYELVDNIKSGEWSFLDLDTPMVSDADTDDVILWGDELRVDIADSMASGLPLGAIVLWRTKIEMPTLREVGGVQVRPANRSPIKTYILDGTKRLAAIYTIFGLGVANLLDPDDETPSPIYVPLAFLEDRGITFMQIQKSPQEMFEDFQDKLEKPEDYEDWWWHRYIEVDIDPDDEDYLRFPLGMILNPRMKFWFGRHFARGSYGAAVAENVDYLSNLFTRYPLTVLVLETDSRVEVEKLFKRLHPHRDRMTRAFSRRI